MLSCTDLYRYPLCVADLAMSGGHATLGVNRDQNNNRRFTLSVMSLFASTVNRQDAVGRDIPHDAIIISRRLLTASKSNPLIALK